MFTDRTLSCALALLLGVGTAPAGGLVDDLENLTQGALPQGIWEDMSTRVAGHTTPETATVVSTIDALGQPTLAIQTEPIFGKSSGFHTPIPRARFHDLTADVRVDSFGDGAAWGMCVGFTTDDGAPDINESPQALVYPWHDGSWHLFVNTPAGGDYRITTPPIVLGKWYTIQIQADMQTGFFNTSIVDTATGTFIGGGPITFAGFSDDYDSLSFFDGEFEDTGTVPCITTIDNIRYEATGVVCPPDFNADRFVDSTDLAILLAAWGEPGADLTNDSVTNSADLAVLLAAWGSCD